MLSSQFERVHYALATAAAAAAIDIPALLFFTQGAVRAVAGTAERPGWHSLGVDDSRIGGSDAAAADRAFRDRGAAGIEELLAAGGELGVEFLVCSMGMRVAGIEKADLRPDLRLRETGLTDVLSRGGMPTFV
ncbi:MAG: DsrE/DsrF/DrsH-like family protein [Gemmatimonas sp.]